MTDSKRRRPEVLWFLAALIGLALTQAGHAQREGAPVVEAVFLDTDPGAAKKLGAARDLIAARQWGDGIELIRQIAEQHGDRLVSISPRRYVSVATYCDILLSSLPEAGLKLYRARTDPQAKRWFEAARAGSDEQGLQKIIQRAFLSSYGDKALLLLGQLAWERGNLAQARSFWEQLLPLEQAPEPGQLPPLLRYPSANVDAAQIRARLVLCSVMQGQRQRGQRELADFRREFPQAEGTLAGQKGNLGEILAAQATQAARESSAPVDSELQTFAGNARRDQVQSQPVDVGSVQWSVKMPLLRADTPPRGDELFEGRQLIIDRGPAALAHEVLCYYPLIHENVVLACDETSVFAWELVTRNSDGQPAWGKDATIYKLPEEMMGSPGPNTRRVGLPRFTMSVDGGRLFAHLGNSAARGRNRALTGPASLLVCLDLNRQGDLIWKVKPEELRDEGTPWAFDGAPLAIGGRVYIALRRREPQLQLNVACLDAATGHVVWNRKICLGLENFGPEIVEIHHQLLTIADERLYYCTNRGAVAALNIHDGAPLWVTTYPRADVETASAFNRRQVHGPNPCVHHDGLLFVAPTDCDRVLAYDAETGLLEWDRELRGNAHQLVGVDDGKLIVAGDLLWALDIADGRTEWIAGQMAPEAATRGRCAIGGGLVYWPRREDILLVDTTQGKIRREIDLTEQHGLSNGGNITLTDGYMLFAQADRIAVFSEFGSLRKRREDQISRRPEDPRAYFELGLLAEATGDVELAQSAYDRARELARPSDLREGTSMKVAASRRLSRFLTDLGAKALAAGREAEAIARLSEATEIATTPAVNLAAGRALARAHEQLGDLPESVAAWQRLLDDWAAGRDLADADLLAGAREARAAIDRLISKGGRAVYAEIERTAETAFAEALHRRNLKELTALVARYPHALAADSAALQLAAFQRAAGDTYAADRTYKGRLDTAVLETTRTAVLSGLARNAESRRHWRTAQRYWRELYDHHGSATVSLDGTARPVHEVIAERLDRLHQLADASERPGAQAAPLRRSWERNLNPGSTVIVPDGLPPSDALSSILIAGETLACLDASSGQTRWETALPENPQWARFMADVLILGTSNEALGVAPEDGRVLWRRTIAGATSNAASGVSFRATGDRLACLSDATGVWSLYPETGDVAWRYAPGRGAVQPHWQGDRERIALQRLAPDRWEILNAIDGTIVAEVAGPDRTWRDDPVLLPFDRTLAFAADHGAPRLLNAHDGTVEPLGETPWIVTGIETDRSVEETALVAAVDPTTLARFDAKTGRKLWSCRAGVALLSDPHRESCQDSERVFTVTAGVLRCQALDDGRLLWEQYVGPRGEWRVATAGRWIAAYRASTVERATIVLCDPASGEFAQRLHSEGPTTAVRFHPVNDQAVIVTDTRLYGFRSAASAED